MIHVLDQGYVKLVTHWGSDEQIIEAARMSTDKGFLGWGKPNLPCIECQQAGRINERDFLFKTYEHQQDAVKNCKACSGLGYKPGDEKLLKYLWTNKHYTPFEMAGLTIEVKAPIMVFREWHRHRTQSYNEMSARYIPLPDENYIPTVSRIIDGAKNTTNRQAQGLAEIDPDRVDTWLQALQTSYNYAQHAYELGLKIGVPKELARLSVPVARYSRMRAQANLRNWIAFLELRMDPHAQWEIRQYANIVGIMIKDKFPRTWEVLTLPRDWSNAS